MKCTGVVAHSHIHKGSKSERTAVVLDTGKEQLVLRILGGNAWHDDRLEALVGKRITAVGKRAGETLLMTEWKEK